MPLRPYTGLSLGAVIVAATVGVAAQNSNTNAGASGSRVLPDAQTTKAPSPLADAVQQQNKRRSRHCWRRRAM